MKSIHSGRLDQVIIWTYLVDKYVFPNSFGVAAETLQYRTLAFLRRKNYEMVVGFEKRRKFRTWKFPS